VSAREGYREARPEVAEEVLSMCPRCEARPGEMCTTISGKPAGVPHSSRGALGYVEWGKGYRAGAESALDLVERYIERTLRDTADGSGRGDLSTAVQTALALSRKQFAK
jgi:hypothetical protein